jgi:hypothetical protein
VKDEYGRLSRDRIPTYGQLRGEVMVFQPMTILNISYHGVQIETPFPLQLDSLHQFRLSLGDLAVVVRGRIANCRLVEVDGEAVSYRTGVEFIEPSEHVVVGLASFVEALREAPARAGAGVVDGEVIEEDTHG